MDGIYRFDLVVTDQQGRRSYANLKVRFLRVWMVDSSFYYPMYLATLTYILSMCLYFVYMFVTIHALRMRFRGLPKWQWPLWMRAVIRFGRFDQY